MAPASACKEAAAAFPLPEPRVPYPRLSALTERDQRSYVELMQKFQNVQPATRLQGKVYGSLALYSELKNAVWSEIPEFMKYLQNVARMCAEDYKVINHEAARYVEEVLQAWNESLKKYPELYTVNEITSIMGGKFIPDLTLRLEKQLLCMGRALYLRVPTRAASIQLPTDYKTIASFIPPSAVRTSAFESDISSDVNAERLSVKYGAKVSLTSRALFTLLNNCGPNYTEPWEIPLHVKTICGEGNQTEKVVFIDSPLPKKELAVREKNLLFYEVPLDLMMSKKSFTPMSNVTQDKPQSNMSEVNEFHSQEHQRCVTACEGSDLDFSADFTQLETFGAVSSGPSRKALLKADVPKASKWASRTNAPRSPPALGCSKDQDLAKTEATETTARENQLSFPLSAPNCGTESKPTDSRGPPVSDQQKDEAKREGEVEGGSATLARNNSDEVAGLKELKSDSDSDAERLVIDATFPDNRDSCSPAKAALSDVASLPEKHDHQGPEEVIPDTPQSPPSDQDAPSSQKMNSPGLVRKRKASKALSKEFDPVGQILRMQCKLLKSTRKHSVDHPQAVQQPSSQCQDPLGQSPFDRTPITIPSPESHTPATFGNVPSFSEKTAQNTRTHLLSEELLNCEESVSDYTAPSSGNVTYKLFSLSDLLVLVRGRIQKTQIRPRAAKGARRKHVPVYVLPKLEYQSMYGIEAFTESEICQLWTESLINSNSWFYIGHIDVFTSKLILIDQFPAASLMDKLGSFKPVNSLNILHHILRKVTSLPEDRYLLSHSPGDSYITIYRTSRGGKFTRAAYNLHAAHSTVPAAPATLSVPWVCLDSNVLLPYHIHHGRAPCTFPPRPTDGFPNKKVAVAKASRDVLAQGEAVSTEMRRCPSPTQQVCPQGKVIDIRELLSEVCLAGDEISCEATVKPFANFDANNDATMLARAIETKGVDEHTIIDILTHRSNAQRQDIMFAFEKRSKKPLEDVLNSALKDPLKSVILGLLKPPAKYDALEMKKAVKGLGTKEDALIEILCSRTNVEIREMKKAYYEVYKKDMISDIKGDTSGDFRKLLCALAEGKRPEPSNVEDYNQIDSDAKALYEAVKQKKGIDTAKWITILTERSAPHLVRVFQRYNTYSPSSVSESIKEGLSKDLKNNLLALVQCIQSTPMFFANKLSQMIQGDLGRDVLTRIMVSRSEIDLLTIRREFKKKTGRSLYQSIKATTKDDYEQVLLALCGGND
ncbi:little elongation complex subunit 2-like isoform X2 [Narcine bancroftii]|uniref:little elongation complex subunit 2-like isoform X2 n=1 Tax=Narcine bancroftii TaxID=1343680 RepID=UPI0038314CDD